MTGPTPLAAGGPNAIAVTLGVLGDEWNLWILRHAVDGCRRYGDWRSRGPISHTVLTSRLGQLTEAGLVERVRYSERPERFEYLLTARGRGVWPVLLAMWAWEKDHAPDGGVSAGLPGMRHRGCDEAFSPVAACSGCGGAVTRRDVSAALGPSGDWSRSVPDSVGRRRSAGARRPTPYLPLTMELLGNRWSAALLGALMLGGSRFGDLARRTGAPPATLADRLRRFESLGVVTARPSPERADWATYALTAGAEAFFPVIALMIAWGQHWYRAPEGPAIELTHTPCGAALRVRLCCDRCGVALHAGDVLVEPQGAVASRPGGAAAL